MHPYFCLAYRQNEAYLYGCVARVTVHFSAVCDRFSPFDTEFSITAAKELKDTKLSAACSLHAASGSTSSSTSSLRRRRLMEIAEEEEEEERERKRQSIVNEEDRPSSPDRREDGLETPVKLDADLARHPEASRFADETEPPAFTGIDRPTSPTKSLDDSAPRFSSQSSRLDYYTYKPRVMLGPRPSVESGRPPSSAGTSVNRPVSSIPVGFKLFSKGSKKGQGHEEDETGASSPIKEEGETSDQIASLEASEQSDQVEDESARPHTSGGAQDLDTPASPPKSNMPHMAPPPTKQNTITPEKARLLKAMKLREKKKMMSVQPAPDVSTVEEPSEPTNAPAPTEPVEVASDADGGEELGADSTHLGERTSVSKADSGIDIEVGTDHASVGTHTDSHPASPVAPSSDTGDYTQASSLSESTDETVLAGKELDQVEPSGAETSPTPERDITSSEQPKEGDSLERKAEATEAEEDPSLTANAAPSSETPETEPTPEAPEHVVDESVPAKVETPEASANVDAPPAKEVQEPLPSPGIPVSKFSTQGNKSPTSASSPPVPSIIPPSPDVDQQGLVEPGLDTSAKESGAKTGIDEATSIDTRRSKGRVPETIRTDLGLHQNDKRDSMASFMSEDGLLEELQSATLHQAQPITVSKSPVNAFFSSDATLKKPAAGQEGRQSPDPRFSRAVSNPVRSSLLSPDSRPGSARSVSSSAVFLQKVAEQQPADLKPKSTAKVGSSISQRIKALEKLSGSSGAASPVAPKERPSSTFFSVRQKSIRDTSRPPSVIERTNSVRMATTPSPSESLEPPPESARNPTPRRTGSMASRLSMFESGTAPKGRPESIQVTARIIRDPSQTYPKAPESKKTDPADFGPLYLKQSQLVVDLQKRAQSPAPSITRTEQGSDVERKSTLLQRRLSKGRRSESRDRRDVESVPAEDHRGTDEARPKRTSMAVVKDFIKDRRGSLIGGKVPSTDNLSLTIPPSTTSLTSPTQPTSARSASRPPPVHHNSSLTRRLSISSRRSSIDQKSPAVTNVTSPSHGTEASGESDASYRDQRRGSGSSGTTSPTPSKSGSSRASRFIRRLSNTLNTTKKAAPPSISPTVAEENAAEVEAASKAGPLARGGAAATPAPATPAAPQQPATIVSFMGDVNVQFPDNLLWKRRAMALDSHGFLILSTSQAVTGAVKRYHMSEFKAPYTPEMELQELPNSVVLDFVEGSSLQVACVDRAGQMNVLQSKCRRSFDVMKEANELYSSSNSPPASFRAMTDYHLTQFLTQLVRRPSIFFSISHPPLHEAHMSKAVTCIPLSPITTTYTHTHTRCIPFHFLC